MDKIRKAFTVFLILIIAALSLTFLTVKADSNQPIIFSSGLTLYSPVNTTYSSNILECNGTIDIPKDFQSSLNYSIDGKEADGLPWPLDSNSISNPFIYTIAGSFQLPQLPNGLHRLNIGISEERFNDSGELINQTTWINTVYFTINTSQPTPTPTPTIAEFSWLAILPLLISMLPIAVTIRHRTVHLVK
jgi:hypothetical protein